MQTITIELRFDNADKSHVKILEETAQQLSQQLVTTAELIAGKRKPQIALRSSDAVAGTKIIPLFGKGQKL